MDVPFLDKAKFPLDFFPKVRDFTAVHLKLSTAANI